LCGIVAEVSEVWELRDLIILRNISDCELKERKRVCFVRHYCSGERSFGVARIGLKIAAANHFEENIGL